MSTSVEYRDVEDILRASGVRHRKGSATIVAWIDSEPGHGMRVNSFWDGGSRDEYSLVHLPTMQARKLPTSTHPHFDLRPDGTRTGILELCRLPDDCVLVEGGIFCGKTSHAVIHARAENLAKLLPDDSSEQLDERLQHILHCFASYNSQGRKEYLPEANYTETDRDLLASLELVKVNKAGAVQITAKGRNAAKESRNFRGY